MMVVYYISLAVCLAVIVLQCARMHKLDAMIDRLVEKAASLPPTAGEKGRVISPYKDKDGES